MNDTTRVWFHRTRALIWATIGALSFVLGFANSVVLVWIASLYANIISDWTAAEAADNRELHHRFDHLETLIKGRHMADYHDITRAHPPETLHIADETNHLQYIPHTDIPQHQDPFEEYCHTCNEWHHWRRVWVTA